MTIIEQAVVTVRWRCDFCGAISDPVEEEPPEGWIEYVTAEGLEFARDFFREHPEVKGVTGWIGPEQRCHFDSEEHLEAWTELPLEVRIQNWITLRGPK